jgi:hypothetical protein
MKKKELTLREVPDNERCFRMQTGYKPGALHSLLLKGLIWAIPGESVFDCLVGPQRWYVGQFVF